MLWSRRVMVLESSGIMFGAVGMCLAAEMVSVLFMTCAIDLVVSLVAVIAGGGWKWELCSWKVCRWSGFLWVTWTFDGGLT